MRGFLKWYALYKSTFYLLTYLLKGSPYSITECRFPELIPVFWQSACRWRWVINLAVGCHYFLPGLKYTRNRYEGCYQFCCLVNRGTMGVNSLPRTVTRQRCGCDLNPGPSASELNTLTTQLLGHPANFSIFDTLVDNNKAQLMMANSPWHLSVAVTRVGRIIMTISTDSTYNVYQKFSVNLTK